MMLSRSIRRFAALAALIALTLQALWPLVSHAGPKDRTLLAPLCTVDGITHYLEIKTGKTAPLEQRSAQHGEHCKLCVFGDAKVVVATAPDTSVFLLVGTKSHKTAYRPVPSSEPANHPPAQPRAPPAIA